MTTEIGWRSLQGEILDARFEIGELLQQIGSATFFRARDLSGPPDLLLRLEEEAQESAGDDFDRFREAAFLEHPNLLRVRAAGRSECRGIGFIYLVTESADGDLAEALQRQPMRLDEISDLLKQVIAGLRYVHSENLVYCALRAASVWRVEGQWKLADYTQLRVAGKYSAQETRQLMLMPGFESPPESNQGIVSEAWDVWSLASMLRKILLRQVEPAGNGTRSRAPVALHKFSIPAPFDRILLEALDPDPGTRATFDRVLEMLATQHAEPVAPDPITFIEQPDPKPATHEEVSPEPQSERWLVPPPRSLSSSPQRKGSRTKPLILGGIVAASAAVVLALAFPSRITHPQLAPQQSRASAPSIEPASVKSVPPPEPDAAGHSPFGGTALSAEDNSRTQQAISALLTRWVAATRNRNVDEEVSCYTPVVDKFYGQRGVPESRLRSQEQNVFSRIGAVRKFEISNVQFNRVGPEWAVVSFDKNWDFGSRTRFAGSAREELVLRPIRGQWKIASEREVKVYWVDKQAM